MRAGQVETITATPGAAPRRSHHFPKIILLKIIFLCAPLAFILIGCGASNENSPPPTFIGGTNYASVATNISTAGIPRTGVLSLYQYPDGPKGPRSLLWPFINPDDQAVFGKLIVFNGGVTDDLSWKYYPALLAYAGNGVVVEISRPASRHVRGWKPEFSDYAFAVLSVSNDFVRLDASQRPPVDEDRPKRLEVDLDKNEILRIIQSAQTNGNPFDFNGIKYFVAQ